MNDGTQSSAAPPGFWAGLARFLEGRKTYLIAIVAGVYLFGGDQGWWVVNESLLGILGFGGLATLRRGISSHSTRHPQPTSFSPSGS